ncbi:MAG: hypothetical protein KAX20_00475 [Candidatus Omnitrophica bacterium]|nr:hypothetical protein [Candidatus Omnitrophota bacterium]
MDRFLGVFGRGFFYILEQATNFEDLGSCSEGRRRCGFNPLMPTDLVLLNGLR